MSRVLVACGGRSLERSISLESGRRAQRALAELGHDARIVDVDQNFVETVKEHAPDFIFIAMHGPGGEDGTVQDLLEILHVPYTGSGAPASALCLDKHLFKSTCTLSGVPTPAWHSFTRQAFAQYGAARALPNVMEQFPSGVVVKPASQGSSLGISVAHDEVALRGAILSAMSYDERVLLERYVPGREIAVTVIGPPDDPRVLPVAEILFEDEIYSFTAHYEIGSAHVRRAELDPEVQARIEAVAARAYSASGCRDFARVDIRLDGDDVQVLEINTIPGLTETGPAPLAAEMGGLSFVQFIEAISARALAESQREPSL
jgi:D-alanine-D-alanine ligase